MADVLLALLLVLSSAAASSASGSRRNPEVRALMELKDSLDPDGLLLPSWTFARDPCRGDFEGVACNAQNRVTNISLQGKGLRGSLSPAVARLRRLSGLFLHYNALSGDVPRELADLADLSDLYLNVNNLSGTIPPEIGNMGSLQVLQLCHNQLSGSIPTQLGLLKKLSVLSLQSNNLTGAIPASLGDLTQLTRLDLSSNRLFGSIPVKLTLLSHLVFLDVQSNSLSGSVPPELRVLRGGFFYGNNTDLCGTGFPLLRACSSADALSLSRPEPYRPNSTLGADEPGFPQSANVTAAQCGGEDCSSKPRKISSILVDLAVVATVAGGIVSGLLAFMWYRRQKQRIGSSVEASETRLSTDRTKDVCTKSASSLISIEYSNGWDPLSDARSGLVFSEEVSQSLRFNLEEVEAATQYFSDVNLLGRSNFTATYRGILRDGSVVAVKSISKTSCKSEEADFLKGLKVITGLRHDNLVGLRGFCCSRGRGECFLVHDFVANGSLSRFLDVKGKEDASRVLDWATRVSIIKGIAKGIEYLHSNKTNKPALVHQNISVDNILIDHRFKPLLSGAGIHKILVDDVVYSTLKGSAAMGYLAPEYTTTGRFTEKSDVYAFGVIIFQILAGKRKATHLHLTLKSGDLEDLIDENLHGDCSKLEAAKLVGIALACTSEAPEQRPTMEAVVQELNCRS